MVISQGDIYWYDDGIPVGSTSSYRRPHVVIQNNAFNVTRIQTVVVCPLSTNLRLADAPGNVLLNQGECSLSKRSVVNVSQIFTVDKRELEGFIGRLSAKRVRDILQGIAIVLEPREPDKE